MKRVLLLIYIGLLGLVPIHAQEIADSACIYYRTGYRFVELDYRTNRDELNRFCKSIRQAAEAGTLERIVIQSGASPDGTQRANDRLTKYRADSLAAYLLRATGILQTQIEKQPIGILWGKLREQVAASDMPYRDKVLYILDNEPLWTFDAQNRVIGSRKKTLMDLHGGVPYNYMLHHFFPDLHNSTMAVLYVKEVIPEEPPTVELPETDTSAQEIPQPTEPTPEPTPEVPVQPIRSQPQPQPVQDTPEITPIEEWNPGIRIKTNVIGWALMMVNAAVEIDISRHLSFNLPIYYSGCDYFTSTTKFRILGTQPELRIWPLRERRFFAGVHFGVASYNMALGGDWRIQDHNGNSPALGGGINIGYLVPLGRSERWSVEFSLGAGIYNAHYDKFHNENNGGYSSTVRKTFIGLDNAAISFSYMFDLKKNRK